MCVCVCVCVCGLPALILHVCTSGSCSHLCVCDSVAHIFSWISWKMAVKCVCLCVCVFTVCVCVCVCCGQAVNYGRVVGVSSVFDGGCAVIWMPFERVCVCVCVCVCLCGYK